MLEEARLLPGFFFAIIKQGSGVGWINSWSIFFTLPFIPSHRGRGK
jgi:hypothetical protein